MSAEIITMPWIVDQERRERMAGRVFNEAVKASTRGGYRRAARRIQPLLNSSPRSERMAHLVQVCRARAEGTIGQAVFCVDGAA